jgi:hypothetical protein
MEDLKREGVEGERMARRARISKSRVQNSWG